MQGKIDDNLTLVLDGQGVTVSGPLKDWDADEKRAWIHASISQDDVVAVGRTDDSVANGASSFTLTANVEGTGKLTPTPASATAWAIIEGDEGIEVYGWSVPVTLSLTGSARTADGSRREHTATPH
jgi:hypothetical protein